MPLLLYSYILTETIAPFLASLLILGGILFLGQILPLFELIIDYRVNPLDFLRLCIYLTPSLLLFAIPMASMLGVIICFSRMVTDNEIIALKSSGLGTNNLVPPVAFFALATAGLTLYMGTGLIPASTVATEKLLFKIASERFGQGLKDNQFSEGIGGVVFYIDRITPDSRDWEGVYISDTRDRGNPMTVTASRGQFRTRPEQLLLQVTLEDGAIHHSRTDARGEDAAETIQFDKYSLNLPLQYPRFLDHDKAEVFGKKGMSQEELLNFARQRDPSDEERISKMIEYHNRMVLAVGCFLLTILALPLAIRNRPGSRAVALPFALLLFVLYYILLTGAKAASESGINIGLAMWTPNALFGLFTGYLLAVKDKKSHETLLDCVLRPLARIGRLFKGGGGT